MYTYNGTVVYVVDGDTVDILVDLGFDISYKIRVRMLGIDTPEMKGKKAAEREHAKQAKAFVETTVLNKQVVIKTYKDDTDKYGRYLAEIYLEDGQLLQTLITGAGLLKKESY
jgi:micrococcal nuclease